LLIAPGIVRSAVVPIRYAIPIAVTVDAVRHAIPISISTNRAAVPVRRLLVYDTAGEKTKHEQQSSQLLHEFS
jgi:hypothetical protein